MARLGERTGGRYRFSCRGGTPPLAVHVLGAYTKRSGLGFAAVPERLRGNAASADDLNMPELADYSRRELVVGALRMTCRALDVANVDSLQRLSMLAPDRVPRVLFGADAETHRLWDLDIVTYPEPGLLTTHRLVQAVQRA